jgi:hypothetical protein
MNKKISKSARNELLGALRQRYMKATKKEKKRILDEFVAVSGYHRKHAVRLLGKDSQKIRLNKQIISKRIYNEAVKEALTIVWEAADRICSKRLKAIMPELIDAMERHNHLELDPEVRQRLFEISTATIDRLLSEVRKKAHPHKKKRKSSKRVRSNIAVHTFGDWNEPPPGYCEIDFVVHSGGSTAGKFIHTLVATDVCSGWIECIPLLSRDQTLVVEGLGVLRRQLPFPLLGIDSDNDSAFINDTLLEYCNKNAIGFTRSRPFRKNDQAWVEQKNGSVVRRFVGYDRFSGVVAGQALAQLYQMVRLYVNYFQPSFKLQEKHRQGAKVRRLYRMPATPCNRLLSDVTIEDSTKKRLQLQRLQLDPVKLLHQIRDKQSALAALAAPEEYIDGPGRTSLDQFLAQLPQLWRSGDARPTHWRNNTTKTHYWRTREDPFKDVWANVVLCWLQNEPDITAKELFERLQMKHPGVFADGQLRTLQRRIREWRQIMAKKLVYSFLDVNPEDDEIVPIGANSLPGL